MKKKEQTTPPKKSGTNRRERATEERESTSIEASEPSAADGNDSATVETSDPLAAEVNAPSAIEANSSSAGDGEGDLTKRPKEYNKPARASARGLLVRQIFDHLDRVEYTTTRAAEDVLKIFGTLPPDDPYDFTPQTDADVYRLALDLILGPIFVPPIFGDKKKKNSVKARWVNFEIAFGAHWTHKLEIARFLYDHIDPTTGQHTLPRSGDIVFGPSGTAFHVALQFAWRLRKSIQQDEPTFEGTQISFHSDSFEIARLLAPLATEPTVKVYFMDTNVSRNEHTERNKVSVVFPDPDKALDGAKAKGDPWIDCLVIGCQAIDRLGTVHTWPQERPHSRSIQRHLDHLKPGGRLILVCIADKFKKEYQGGDLRIDHPKEHSFIFTDQKPGFDPEGFQVCVAPVNKRLSGK